jgi:hypothetical protein
MLFPALLYDHARFRTLQDVFSYVRERLRARYDVFSNATREFQNSNNATQHRRAIPVVSMNFMDAIGQVAISDLFRTFMYGAAANADGASSNPTTAQIESATQRLQYIGPENIACAVCQDSFAQNDAVRRINACQHIFHDGCLATWFIRHSTCPLCRNDIRLAEPGPDPGSAPFTTQP